MSDTGDNRLSVIRGVLEALTVAFLLWTVNTLGTVKEQNAVLAAKIDTVREQTSDFPAYKIKTAENTLMISALQEEVKELRAIRKLK